MHRNVEILIGRLVTDAMLRNRFAGNPVAVLEEQIEQGLEFTRVELEALAATAPEALRSLAGSLDRRLCKASIPEPNLPRGAAPSAADADEETER